MAVKTSPITPAVLTWAVQQDGRSLGEVAGALRLERELVESWATGEEQPTRGQVTELANVLGRPRAFFFLPEPPAKGALPAGFRHPPGGRDEGVPPRLLLQARRAKRMQQAISATLTDDEAPRLPRARLDDSPAAAAGRVVSWLEWRPGTTWPDDYAALRDRRRTLEEAGVLVFALQLGKGEVRGFAHYDDRAPMIVTNVSSVLPTARSFTIGHELGHLVLRDSTACVEPRRGRLVVDNRTERWCEAFAGALLMPAAEVRSLMRHIAVQPEQADIAAVREMMRRFRVSARAAAVRLSDLGYAAEGLYGAVLRVFKPSSSPSTSDAKSPPRHQLRLRQYGEATVSHVMSALPPRDALSVLGLTVADARQMAAELPGVSAI